MILPVLHDIAENLGCAALLAGFSTLGACAGDPEPPAALLLEGASELRIAHLGAVEGPRAVLSDGTPPVGLEWSVSPETVAVVAGAGIEAVGPGTAVVTGRWQEQSVSWTLLVEPDVALRFVEPPDAVSVGEAVLLRVQGHLGDEVVDAGALTWASSNEEVLTVADGTATGRGSGVVYVTAESVTGSRAMVQLQVIDVRTTRE